MSTIAKIFKSGGSQAVRIPKEFRLPGKEVRIHRIEGGKLVLEPVAPELSLEEWFELMRTDREKYGPLELDIPEPELPPDDISLD